METNTLPSIQLSEAYFYNFYCTHILWRGKFGSYNVDKTAEIMWDMLQSNEVMEELSKHKIKLHPSITSICVHFLITSKILEPLKEIYQMKIDINILSTKSNRHNGRLYNIEE